MTVKDLKWYYNNFPHFKRGYVCYQDEGLHKSQLVHIGSNSGVYGWNWTLYLHLESSTLYCSCYRNVPKYLVEK